MKENWAKSLKQRMAGFEQPVDDALWAGIARASVAGGIRWWPWVTAALASAAAVITVVVLLQPEPTPVAEPFLVSSGEMVAAVEEEPITNTPVRLAQTISVHPFIEAEEPSSLKGGDENEKPDTITPQGYSAKEEPVHVDEPVEDDWTSIIDEEEPAPRRSRLRIATSLYAQASPLGNRYSAGSPQTQEENTSPENTYPDYPPASVHIPGEGDGNPGGDMDSDLPDDDDETKALGPSTKSAQTQSATASPEWTHAFPVQIGARVSLSWSERWSIDTGLTFMHFHSWNARSRQRMEFLGIPLYVNYRIGSARNFSFYASVGGQVFKCFAGNAPDKPWLFSCGLGGGAEYHLSPLVSLYVQPGADWYFHTGVSRHYYSENPFAFSLSVGFRLHFLSK